MVFPIDLRGRTRHGRGDAWCLRADGSRAARNPYAGSDTHAADVADSPDDADAARADDDAAGYDRSGRYAVRTRDYDADDVTGAHDDADVVAAAALIR